MAFETARQQWQDGERRVAALDPDQRPTVERVIQRIVAELRRRLGGAFTLDELVELYEVGTAWTGDIAYAVAPGAPYAWDQRLIGDAAFWRYSRDAVDYAGGRRIDPRPPED